MIGESESQLETRTMRRNRKGKRRREGLALLACWLAPATQMTLRSDWSCPAANALLLSNALSQSLRTSFKMHRQYGQAVPQLQLVCSRVLVASGICQASPRAICPDCKRDWCIMSVDRNVLDAVGCRCVLYMQLR